jgi:hypothetical protein
MNVLKPAYLYDQPDDAKIAIVLFLSIEAKL